MIKMNKEISNKRMQHRLYIFTENIVEYSSSILFRRYTIIIRDFVK